MKKFLGFLAISLLFASCEDKVTHHYIQCIPVYTDYETFRQPATFGGPQSISENGNIYIKDQYLFIVSPDKGIHFIDNSNPAYPNNLGFLNLKGCTNMAIRGNHLYANSFIDLVIFDISSLTNPVEVSRVEDLFPQALPVMEKNYAVAPIDKNLGVVTAWEYQEVEEDFGDGGMINWGGCMGCDALTFEAASAQNSPSTGMSGSITRFTIINDFLYVVDYGVLHPVQITNPLAPEIFDPVYTGRMVETLFPHDDLIFMGTTTGMLIYNTTDPSKPEYVSSVNHMTACDPVVVQGNYAYVTVRTGTTCMGEINQLEVIDISNIYSPSRVAEFKMTNPHGLGIDGNNLFICDGKDGLKLFDASNPLTCGDNQLQRFKNIEAVDIIPYNNHAIVIGENGIWQYDYSDPSDFKLLSSFSF